MKENHHPDVSNAKTNDGSSAAKGILCVILNFLYIIPIENMYKIIIISYAVFKDFICYLTFYIC